MLKKQFHLINHYMNWHYNPIFKCRVLYFYFAVLCNFKLPNTIQAIAVVSMQSEAIGLLKDADLIIFALNAIIKQINHFDGIIS